jgi:hypothetical protein
MNTTITFTIKPIPRNVTSRPMSVLTAALAGRSIACKPSNGDGPRVVAFMDRLCIASHGEVPERLNGRDWKSRNGG